MPDIQQQLESLTRVLPSVTEEFQDVARSLDNITGNAESTANAFENLVIKTTDQIDSAKDLEKELPKLAKEMSQLTKGSRLTTKGFKALEDSLGEAGKDLSKSLQAVYGQTDKAIGKVNNAFEKFSSRIPVIGKTIQKGFENFMGSFEGVIDKYMARIQRAGAVGRGGMAAAGILGAAGVAAATLLGRQFSQIEKSSIAISKATGLSGENLKAVRISMVAAQNASYALGISMDESAAAAGALVSSLGNFRKITPELIKQTTMLAKFTGASAEEAGNFVGTLTKGFGKSAEDVDSFVNGIASFASREGVNARKVLGDIVSDTNLMSIYMSRGEDALKRAAVQAAKMGMSLSETQGVSEAFLDLEGGAELVGQINMYTGGSLNALEMFNLAAKNDTVSIMNRLNQAFSTPQGIRFIEDMPGLAKQFAGRFGMNLKQLRIAAGLERDRTKENQRQTKEQKNIEEILKEQQTLFERFKNLAIQEIFPVVNRISEQVLKFAEGVTQNQVKGALRIAAVLGGGLLLKMVTRGTRANPIFTIPLGAGGLTTGAADSPTGNTMTGGGQMDLFGDNAGKSPKQNQPRVKPRLRDQYRTNRTTGKMGRLTSLFNVGRNIGERGFQSVKGLDLKGLAKSGLSGGLNLGKRGLAGGASMLGRGLKSLLGNLTNVRKLFKGGALGAAFMAPEILDVLMGSRDPKTLIPLITSLAGSAIGGAAGSIVPVAGTAAGGLAGGIAGDQLGQYILENYFGGAAAKGQVVSSPKLFMVGEENKKEVIIPTERIRKGLPIDAGVARELGSIGVPGYMTGLGALTGRRSSRAKREQIRSSQATVQQGAQSDPAVIRERELAFERAAQKERDEQRRMMANIEQKSLEILEEEKRAASNISTSHGKFSRGVSLFERIQQAAGQYARKTFNRFADNLKKNNGDLRAALKDTWAQTVGDIEQLQTKLLNKMNSMIAGLVNKLGSYLGNLAKDAGNAVLDFGKKIFGIDNAANAQQFDEGVKESFNQFVVEPATTAFNTTNQTNQEIADRRAQERMNQSTAVSDLSSEIRDLEAQRQGLERGSAQERALARKQRELETERRNLRNQRQMAFGDETNVESRNIAARIAGSIGGAVADARAGFQRGRAFSAQDPATRGELNTEGFFGGAGARVGKLFGDLEQALGPVSKGIGAFTSSLDGASVSMLASGDIAGASVYMAQKAAVDTAIKTSLSQTMPNLGEGNTASLLAGTSALIQGDTSGAMQAVGMDLGRRGVTAGVNAIGGFGVGAKGSLLEGLSVGGGVAAAGLGAVGGIMQGDYKMAAKGAAEGAVGYVIGGALTPVLGPLGPVVGSIVAGPVTDGIITSGKELGKGAKNLGKGVGKLFKGDFKGGLGSLAKGAGQILTSPIKGIGALAKGLGGLVGIGKESKKDKRRKFIKMLMNDLANGKPLVGPGGRLRNKKAQERLLVGLKWGENGPDQALMDEMTAQIMTIAGVPMDIAQAFIFAAAGANFDDKDLAQLDAEMGTGFMNADLSNQFDMSTKRGRRQAYRFLKEDDGANISDTLSTVSDASRVTQNAETQAQSELIKQEIARLSEGGLTVDEIRQVAYMAGGEDLIKTFDTQAELVRGGGTGVNVRTGNVFLDGIMVGTISMEAADMNTADGVPAGMPYQRVAGDQGHHVE